MQVAVTGAAQTQQWSFILSQLFAWVMAGLAWIVPFQSRIFGFVLQGESFWSLAGMSVLLQSVALAWWDALRMVWFYWAGLVKFLIVLVGWTWGLLKLSVQLIIGTLKSAITSPLAMLDATSRRPGVPWPAFFLLIIWSAVEATIFTFTLRPTMSELLADLTGYEVNGFALVLILWIFLAIIIAGSFACIQVLNDAIKARQAGNIVFMILVEISVAMFEVLFLYRELVDAMTPWLAQQGIQLGVFGTIGLAFFGWVGGRGMTWFLFGRCGSAAVPDYWKGPISALKAEREWFRKEWRELFELASLPVLQVVASGMNFLFVVFTGRG